MMKPHCQNQNACQAKGKGHCRRCHMAAAVKANWQDPEFRARNAAAVKANGTGVQIPRWVPPSLVDDYIDIAVLEGEETAASRVRRMKQEAAQ